MKKEVSNQEIIEYLRKRAKKSHLFERIRLYNIAARLERLSEAVDYARTIEAENTRLVAELERMKRLEAAMTAALREYVTEDDHLCRMCRYYDQCEHECENEEDKTTRFWRCKAGEEFEFKEVE